MKRRQFIAGVGSTAVWPLAVLAQQSERTRWVGVLMGYSESIPIFRSYLGTFGQELARLGWLIGGNVQSEQRWTDGDLGRAEALAKELVGLQPDVILAASTPATAALHRETRTIPIVFVIVSDPVGSGFAESLSRPGSNITGFINVENTIAGKELGLLKEIAPLIKRAAMMFNPDTTANGGRYYLNSFEVAARSLAVEPVIVRVHSAAEIDAAITSLGRERAGLVLMTNSFMSVHQGAIASSAARNNVPVIFDGSSFARNGGLMSYGPSYVDMFRRAASHVDRILRGAKPADLPIELPTRFELVVNLMTAKALGLAVPQTLLAAADEVID